MARMSFGLFCSSVIVAIQDLDISIKTDLKHHEFTESNGDWKVFTLKPLEILKKIRTCQG